MPMAMNWPPEQETPDQATKTITHPPSAKAETPPLVTARSGKATRPWVILIGYNTPFILWTGYALASPVLRSLGGGGVGTFCPTHALFDWCPGCGTTSAYSALIYEGRIPDLWTSGLLLGFVIMAIWSLYRALHHDRSPATS